MKSIFIRAEDKNAWERRAPLVPEDVKEILAGTNGRALVEQSSKRIFPEEEYIRAGARVCDDMDRGDIIVGVKEIPVEKLLDDKVYLFFSHVIKGQKANMPMLKRILDGGSTLIDYEKICDDRGRRLIYFGPFAGDAGAIDILWLMGQYWRRQGKRTPLADLRQANRFPSVKEARASVREIGARIRNDGLPEEIAPLVIGILGYGNVAGGARRILDCLPVEHVRPENLKRVIGGGGADPRKVYVTVFKEKHLAKHTHGRPFSLEDYYRHPENYVSRFDDHLPYITILVNAIYWDSRYPRFVTWDLLQKMFSNGHKPRLSGIADISCDVEGSIECNVKTTDSGMPAYRCDPISRSIRDGHEGDGIVVLAVDNLPCELPNDSSVFFSNQLKPFIPNIATADYEAPLEKSGLDPEILNAVIAYQGELTPSYRYLNRYIH